MSMRTQTRERFLRTAVLQTALLAFLLSSPRGTAAADAAGAPVVAGLSHEEALELGEKMYVEGFLPSGKPLQGLVQGDIPVSGEKFTCANCHQRSGFGSAEGSVRTAPIDGTRLYEPLSNFKGIPLKGRTEAAGKEEIIRPAYTDATLARVLQTGLDPAGRQLSSSMPKYFLDDRESAVMVYYLKHLSTGPQPGVTETGLRFATIVTDDVPPEDREAMVRPLRLYLENWRLSRGRERMARTESFIKEGATRAVRRFSLALWELKGPADTWQEQMEDYYRKDPVFALLGGVTGGDWTPIARFCEARRIPAIFPITDLPDQSGKGWYTLYLSKGLSQEGEAAANYLNSNPGVQDNSPVVQVYRRDQRGMALAKAFENAWTGLGRKAPFTLALDREEPLTPAFWKELAKKHRRPVILLWFDAKDFPGTEVLSAAGLRPRSIFASSSMLGQGLFTLPKTLRSSLYLTYPYTLPQDAGRYQETMESTLKKSQSPGVNLFLGYKMQALRLALNGPLSMMRTYVYRDYFLELFDETADLSMLPVPYPRLSFGAGQRYASKGCYIVQLSEGPQPELIKKSEWVIH